MTFQNDYLAAWIEPNDRARRDAIERVWDTDAELSVSSTGETLRGIHAIEAHIGAVHGDLIATKGLTFQYDQELTSGDALLLRWSMTAPTGAVVGRGVDTVFRNADGRVSRAYMFMGVS
ncbi:nuclear transport factor 2 family protein [Microbacterium sp. ZW T5_56]|uniref:nuclear transport factor 2 family protein n=1 Tax=Microbacterium sp. ZW T5_56 TaxID=3378081 RepID=UPI003852EB68